MNYNKNKKRTKQSETISSKRGMGPIRETGKRTFSKKTSKLAKAITHMTGEAHSKAGAAFLTGFIDAQLKSGPVKKFSLEEIAKYENELNK